MRFIMKLTLLLFINFFGVNVYAASTWRCSGGALVSSGNTQLEVVERCGEPSSRAFLGYGRRVVSDRYGEYFDDVPLEEWIYTVRRDRYYVLKFEDGRLREIKSYYFR